MLSTIQIINYLLSTCNWFLNAVQGYEDFKNLTKKSFEFELSLSEAFKQVWRFDFMLGPIPKLDQILRNGKFHVSISYTQLSMTVYL